MNLITINNCKIADDKNDLVEPFSWEMNENETWLVAGSNGSGKADFIKALAGQSNFIPIIEGLYSNKFENSVEIVSLEKAAALIKEERDNDEGDYIEGGIDIGRTGRKYISEILSSDKQKQIELSKRLESYPEVKLCGIEKILDRGLKYLSTGEIRRTLLCRALLSGKQLIILSDPFAGLDVESRTLLLEFFNKIASKHGNGYPNILISMERYAQIPDAVTNVIEFKNCKLSFSGTRKDYETFLNTRKEQNKIQKEKERQNFIKEVQALQKDNSSTLYESLVDMKNVKVQWDDHVVLDNFTWKLLPFEHTLIRGPNGSGKTTLLELITGDNMQVFSNDVSLFGKRRGTGETIWELKEKMGIVSYRLHLEYRMVGGIDLESVILSGFHDSIGLYEQKSQVEQLIARKWLALAGFAGREDENFANLSYGEQRLILIVRSVVKCPPLLILDEPCHGLDEESRQRVLDLLDAIAATKITTLLHVTHEVDEVLDCEKHIVELYPNKTPMYSLIKL